MDDIKLFVKKWKRTGDSNAKKNILSGYRNGIRYRKFFMLVMRKGKWEITEGIELQNSERIRILGEKETNKYLRTVETDVIKQEEIKKAKRTSLTRKLETNRNLIKVINTWAVSLVRYSGRFLKWMSEELQQMDQRTIKLTTIHKGLHPRDDIDGLYVSRKEE